MVNAIESERAELETAVFVTVNAFTRRAYDQEKAAGRDGAAHHAVRAGINKLLAERRGLSPLTSEPIRGLV